MAALLNRARMSTATTGTGTVTLGSAVTGYFSFAEAGAVNATVYSYCIEDGDDFEIGVGTYTSSGTTFSRDTVTGSKIGGTAGTSKVNLSGNAQIFITALSADFLVPDGDKGDITVSSSGTVWTVDKSVQTATPTSNVSEVAFTGLSGYSSVEFVFAFTHNNAASSTYNIEGRVSGGTWRVISNVASLADATSQVQGGLTIRNFNQMAHKIALGGVGTGANVLDASDAQNAIANTAFSTYGSYSEMWDELRVRETGGNARIEGATADQRGLFFVIGRN